MPTDLSPTELHAALERTMRWIEQYLASVDQLPVLPRVAPGDIARQLPDAPPAHAESLHVILDDFERIVVPGLTHWNHPGFMAYFAITGSAPGIVAEALAAAVNVNAMLWKTSPAATELEQRALDWLRQMLGLATGWFAEITDTASISTLYALAAAREARPELEIRARGMAGRPDLPALRLYCSEHAHSSVDKAALTLGFGAENIVHVPGDAAFAMDPDALARLVTEDRTAGRLPLAVVATVGTTSAASVDPVPAIADVCAREGMWLHVDASYAGVAAIVPERRDVLAGVDRADSLVVNPHKWLFTPVDISALFTRRPDVLKRAFSLVAEYLVTSERDEVLNLMDYGVQLGRRFRALKLWMVIRAFGTDGIVERLREHMRVARALEGWIRATPQWEVCAPVHFSLVCCRFAPEGTSEEVRERMNTAILERVNATGRVFLSHTKLRGTYVIRVAIGNMRTEESHVAEAWRLLQEAADALGGASRGAPPG